MAEQTITTPSAFSRRSLFSAAAAIPIAAAAGTSRIADAGSPAPRLTGLVPDQVLVLLVHYREVGTRLRKADADFAAALAEMPDWAKPEIAANGRLGSRLPSWTREELAAIGLPDSMPARPSIADLHNFNRELRKSHPMLRFDRKRLHRARVDAWNEKRRDQKAWFTRTGADAVERRRRRLMTQKTAIETQLMELMTGAAGGFAAGEQALSS
ncbi:MAG TPA: hypothetical protein VEX87_27570 [Skermanella sp.]|jgi:hypothetical protein|nr:hypothetical protein [Skermanella sp.]